MSLGHSRKFTHINESFACENCGKKVPPLARGCRNHCPYCLYSKHVDINPGDRANDCHGKLKPVGYELSGKKGIMIEYECESCGGKSRNRAATEDSVQSDSMEVILSLSKDPGSLMR